MTTFGKEYAKVLVYTKSYLFCFFPAVLFGSKILLFTNLSLLSESKSLVHAFTDGRSEGVALDSGPCPFL